MLDNKQKLGHLPQDDGLTEFLIPMLCTGIRLTRVKAANLTEAVEKAKNRTNDICRSLQDFKAQALVPIMVLKPEERAAWPYWEYGWYGTDGIDWRSYRTDKGPADIPDIAEESWPIAPYGGKTMD